MDLTAGSRDSLAGCSWLSLCTVIYNYTLAFLVTIMLYFFYEKGHKTTTVIITLLAWQIEGDSICFSLEFCSLSTAIFISPVT